MASIPPEANAPLTSGLTLGATTSTTLLAGNSAANENGASSEVSTLHESVETPKTQPSGRRVEGGKESTGSPLSSIDEKYIPVRTNPTSSSSSTSTSSHTITQPPTTHHLAEKQIEKQPQKDEDDTFQPEDMGNDLVFLGVDKLSGKAIVKEKGMTSLGGPYTRARFRHYLVWIPFLRAKHPPQPPPDSLSSAPILPDTLAHSSFFSLLMFNWMSGIMALGARRGLTAEDLWKMPEDREPKFLADKLNEAFSRRCEQAEEYNKRLEGGEVKIPILTRLGWMIGKGNGKTRALKESDYRTKTGKRKPDLARSLMDVFGWYFYLGGFMKSTGDTCQICSSLVLKQIILFSTAYHKATKEGTTPPNVGVGIGYAVLLYVLLQASSFANNHFFVRSMLTGVHSRGALITAIFERSMHLSPKARLTHTGGRLVNHISSDVSRIDFACGLFWMVPCGLFQFVLIAIILLAELGYSALVGLGLCLMLTPAQMYLMSKLLKLRIGAMVWVDQRASLLQELLNGIRTVKLYAYESDWLDRLAVIRGNELGYVRSIMFIRGANLSIASGLPVIAAIVSFILYASTNHGLSAASLFSAITLFQLAKLPLMMLPMALGACVDGKNACERLEGVFKAELKHDDKIIDENAEYALRVKAASFTWESSSPPAPDEDPKKKKKRLAKEAAASAKASKKLDAKGDDGIVLDLPVDGGARGVEREIFTLQDITLEVPRGSLVAVVGPIGSGKSSFLSAMLGEMRKTQGEVVWGGKTAYCSQQPWILNDTVRANILFGMDFDEERYWRVVREACLEPDLEALPDGDAEIIGEKGINLSGGQKARVNLARAMYYDAEIICLDDVLAAVDPAVSLSLFTSILRLKGRTRILVTHALHFLPEVDYVVTLSEGRVAEQGTYLELKRSNGAFSALMKEFAHEEEKEEQQEAEETAIEDYDSANSEAYLPPAVPRSKLTADRSRALMSAENMNQGGLRGSTWGGYLKAGRGVWLAPLLLAAAIMTQSFQIVTAYWLVWWQEGLWGLSQGTYEGVYLTLGVASAFSIFSMSLCIAFLLYYASARLHADAIRRIIYSPVRFFDQTPIGRIMNRLTKDIDTLDNTLGDNFRQWSMTASQTAGSIVLIAIADPIFLAPVFVIGSLYVLLSSFYQKSALIFKRIDAVLRSPLYAQFGEAQSGAGVIRAYGEVDRFKRVNAKLMSLENRAYVPSIYNQRWLGVRLDILGCLLSFIVALIVVLTRSLSAAKGGLILSYMVTAQQGFSWVIRQSAEVANDMNSAERVLEYANDLEQERPHSIPETEPPASWPSEGRIEFKNVTMRYRPELPAVLKNLSLRVGAAEKIGVVGRTGAGKSTIMTTLFRLVEIQQGCITIDGVDISKIGLNTLRSRLSIIPQEAFLYSGTIRSNLDPFGAHSDHVLWDALKRSHLVDTDAVANQPEQDGASTPTLSRAFTLDTVVEDDGSNLSVGERSLVSLARALVRNARICVLDECTAAVDLETDAKIQHTIMTQFTGQTLLTIAHRIRTILAYDKILVLAAGEVAEFDTPHALFMREGSHFREMCLKSSITEEDVTVVLIPEQ